MSLLILLALNSVHRYQSRLLYFFNRTHIKKTLDAGQKCVIYINIGKSGGEIVIFISKMREYRYIHKYL